MDEEQKWKAEVRAGYARAFGYVVGVLVVLAALNIF